MGNIFSKFTYGIYGALGGAVIGAGLGYAMSDSSNRVQSIVAMAGLLAVTGGAAGIFLFAPEGKPLDESLKDGATNLIGGIGDAVGNAAEGIGAGIGNIWKGIGSVFKRR